MEYRGRKLYREKHGVLRLEEFENEQLTVLAIPDLHIPFHHPDSFRFLKHLRDEFDPDVVVCLGDEVELASLSFHEKNPDAPSAKDEYEAALEGLKQLYEIFPEVLINISNHGSRFYRVAYAAGIPSRAMKSYHELLEAPKTWHWSQRIVIQNVCYLHGDPKSGANATKAWMTDNKMSTVHGHVHAWAQVIYSADPFKEIFGMNAGALIDPEALAFKYGNVYPNKATLGSGIVRAGRDAHFIPMR
jgi:predicted phosphodiesterase